MGKGEEEMRELKEVVALNDSVKMEEELGCVFFTYQLYDFAGRCRIRTGTDEPEIYDRFTKMEQMAIKKETY
jgi:hypothetical protein